jgi:hypothetical protein
MKRALLIALGVLVPFAALVALGFSMLRDPLSPAPEPVPATVPVHVPVNDPGPGPGPVPEPEPAAVPAPVPAAAAVPAPVPAPVAVEPATADEPRKPMLEAVRPAVQQCFLDVGERMPAPQKLAVVFDTNPDGTFANVHVKKSSWPDPHLAACVIDAFEETRFEATGTTLRRHAHTFVFTAPDAGD